MTGDEKMTTRNGATKLKKLRDLLRTATVGTDKKGIDAYIVGSEDSHQSEYLAPKDQRRSFISGFSGSAGMAIITQDQALLWTDGRYFAQATKELDPPEAWTLMKEGVAGTPTQGSWLASNLSANSNVAVDPNLISNMAWSAINASLVAAGHSFLALEKNFVDLVWGPDKPGMPSNKIVAQPLKYTGKTAGEKVGLCRKAMREESVTTLVVTALDEVAYLLNWRGSDIHYNPVFFAYVVVTLDELHIFVDELKLTQEARQQLKDEGVDPQYHPYDTIGTYLKERSTASDEKTWISNSSSYALHSNCGSGEMHNKLHTNITPICIMKAIKNPTEIEGMKKAHLKDGVALVKYFAWLEEMVKSGESPATELSGAAQLEKFRAEQADFIGPSFSTISAVGPHGAIIHYAPSPETDTPINDREFYLCDSGGQYRDGTTDVTRTVHFGSPTAFERECFTRVFKGQCALASAIFPTMIKGNYLDILARKSLWEVGLDYLHGTAHGVGAYLNVHEGPMGISWRPHPDDPGLQVGMFLSNEPGYYEDEKFGIRLEDIEVIVETATPYNFKSRGFLTFECVTLVPIQSNLLDTSLLTDQEIAYLNCYHAECLKKVGPLLQGEANRQALSWLRRATVPITR
ncbi:xaa-Pro aminopeptidase ApepP isoform X2 [Neodiprion pinetum]|uniref:xaa-Pro aminopeptidase ApepP isoform X2 n=1 Tax=Neodiprion pinetum TaxID=441929 RepID=UPI001EDD2736|nr:xaa-Pro aminopeptidase ApepP isoform X2 [Neodiprion pinetum]XP_046489534.1 xaa-Pro aminopeptidase ApepP isoform X2 [Neodiprion pinetum]